MPDTTPPTTWADTAASLLNKLSGGVELACTFEQMEVQLPAPNPGTAPSTIRLNGSVRIRTRGGDAASSSARNGG